MLTYKCSNPLAECSGSTAGCLQRHFQRALFNFTLECIVISGRPQITSHVRGFHGMNGVFGPLKRCSDWRDLHLLTSVMFFHVHILCAWSSYFNKDEFIVSKTLLFLRIDRVPMELEPGQRQKCRNLH